MLACGCAESLRMLRLDAEWWLTASGGLTRIVILIPIKKSPNAILLKPGSCDQICVEGPEFPLPPCLRKPMPSISIPPGLRCTYHTSPTQIVSFGSAPVTTQAANSLIQETKSGVVVRDSRGLEYGALPRAPAVDVYTSCDCESHKFPRMSKVYCPGTGPTYRGRRSGRNKVIAILVSQAARRAYDSSSYLRGTIRYYAHPPLPF